jgi:hypothetical protein
MTRDYGLQCASPLSHVLFPLMLLIMLFFFFLIKPQTLELILFQNRQKEKK